MIADAKARGVDANRHPDPTRVADLLKHCGRGGKPDGVEAMIARLRNERGTAPISPATVIGVIRRGQLRADLECRTCRSIPAVPSPSLAAERGADPVRDAGATTWPTTKARTRPAGDLIGKRIRTIVALLLAWSVDGIGVARRHCWQGHADSRSHGIRRTWSRYVRDETRCRSRLPSKSPARRRRQPGSWPAGGRSAPCGAVRIRTIHLIVNSTPIRINFRQEARDDRRMKAAGRERDPYRGIAAQKQLRRERRRREGQAATRLELNQPPAPARCSLSECPERELRLAARGAVGLVAPIPPLSSTAT